MPTPAEQLMLYIYKILREREGKQKAGTHHGVVAPA
jgi:hypothetical protein